jgi:hypothetical protein
MRSSTISTVGPENAGFATIVISTSSPEASPT